MKNIITFPLTLLLLAAARAASDADFTIVKASKVTIEQDTITIVCEAYATITLVNDDHIPEYKGNHWHGMPAERVKVPTGNNATLVVRRAPARTGCRMAGNAQARERLARRQGCRRDWPLQTGDDHQRQCTHHGSRILKPSGIMVFINALLGANLKDTRDAQKQSPTHRARITPKHHC